MFGPDAPLGECGRLNVRTSNQRPKQYSDSLRCQIVRTAKLTKNLRNQQWIHSVIAAGAEPKHAARRLVPRGFGVRWSTTTFQEQIHVQSASDFGPWNLFGVGVRSPLYAADFTGSNNSNVHNYFQFEFCD